MNLFDQEPPKVVKGQLAENFSVWQISRLLVVVEKPLMGVFGNEADAAHHVGNDLLLGCLCCFWLLGVGRHVLDQVNSDVIENLQAGAVVVSLAKFRLFLFA